jgi:hypothetical protein
LKSDLLDRRMLPLLALLGVGLIAALAYAVLGGGGSSSNAGPTASVTPTPVSPTGPSLPVSQAPADPHAAVAETTEGARYQHHSGAHNPFTPLASETKPAGDSTGSTSTGGSESTTSAGGSSTSSQSGSSSGGSGETTPSEPPAQPAPTKPKKPKTVYVVDVLYGVAPTTPGQVSQLTPYAGLKRLEPLPSASHPRVVYAGVNASGKDALFTLAGEAILNGEGTCVPRPTQCEALALGTGQSEEFGYLEEDGQSVVYELKVVSINPRKANAATAARVNRLDRAGKALMRRLAPPYIRHLRFSSARGVLVYAAHRHRHR